MPTSITFDPEINKKSGFLEILAAPQDPAKGPKMRDKDRNTLLHLLFWLCSDVGGREFLAKWKEPQEAEPDIRIELKNEFEKRLGTGKPELVEALINGHLAADRFVKAKAANDSQAAATQEQIYLKKMGVVMWYLNEDVSGHEFSLNW